MDLLIGKDYDVGLSPNGPEGTEKNLENITGFDI